MFGPMVFKENEAYFQRMNEDEIGLEEVVIPQPRLRHTQKSIDGVIVARLSNPQHTEGGHCHGWCEFAYRNRIVGLAYKGNPVFSPFFCQIPHTYLCYKVDLSVLKLL